MYPKDINSKLLPQYLQGHITQHFQHDLYAPNQPQMRTHLQASKLLKESFPKERHRLRDVFLDMKFADRVLREITQTCNMSFVQRALVRILGALQTPWWQTHSSSPRQLQRSNLQKQKGKFEVKCPYCAEQTYKMKHN